MVSERNKMKKNHGKKNERDLFWLYYLLALAALVTARALVS